MKQRYFTSVNVAIIAIVTFYWLSNSDAGDTCNDLAAINRTLLNTQINDKVLRQSVRIFCIKCNSTDSNAFQQVYVDDTDDVLKNAFDNHCKVTFTTHGMNYELDGWINTASSLWSKNGANACYILWNDLGTLTRYSYFDLSKTILPKIADYIKRFLYRLKNIGFPLNGMELAGHSLGCHLVAQIARLIKTNNTNDKLFRVFGLDCAQPCFTLPDITPDRITKDVANIVEVIHTNFIAGQVVSVGCLDAYAESVVQPCTSIQIDPNNSLTILSLLTCSHSLAYKIFIEAMDVSNQCVAREFWFFFATSPFFSNRLRLGIHSTTGCTSLTYYLKTKNLSPYCIPQ